MEVHDIQVSAECTAFPNGHTHRITLGRSIDSTREKNRGFSGDAISSEHGTCKILPSIMIRVQQVVSKASSIGDDHCAMPKKSSRLQCGNFASRHIPLEDRTAALAVKVEYAIITEGQAGNVVLRLDKNARCESRYDL